MLQIGCTIIIIALGLVAVLSIKNDLLQYYDVLLDNAEELERLNALLDKPLVTDMGKLYEETTYQFENFNDPIPYANTQSVMCGGCGRSILVGIDGFNPIPHDCRGLDSALVENKSPFRD